MASKPEVIWKSWLHCICGETKDLMLSLLMTSFDPREGVLGIESNANFT